MVESYTDPDRPRGFLNDRHRRYLLGESDIESATQAERDVRAMIRTRLWNAMLDLALVQQHAQQRDLDQTLVDIDDQAQLERDRSMARIVALILRIGDEGLADTTEFERVVQRGARIAWTDAHDTAQSPYVWLGDPDVDLTVEWPDRIDVDSLMGKVDAVWRTIAEIDDSDREEWEREDNDIGALLGLDSLTSDEILFLSSTLAMAESGIGVGEKLANQDWGPTSAVIQAWLVWQQQGRDNLPSNDRHVLAFIQQALEQI